MLWCVWNVWREIENLPLSVHACDRAVGTGGLYHIFVDGRYPDYPGDDDLSTDGTTGYCMDAGTYIPYPAKEVDKRNRGLGEVDTLATEGDWVLVLDADEELLELAQPPLGVDVGIISFVWDSDGEARDRARLYRWEPGLRFKGRHYTLYNSEGKMVATLDRPGLPVGFGLHHNLSHPQERVKDKEIYYQKLVKRERGLPR